MESQTSAGAMPYPAGWNVEGLRGERAPARPFDLRRWFLVASLVALVAVATTTGSILSHVIAEQALERDALLTAQFIQSFIRIESVHIGGKNLGSYLDARVDPAPDGLQREEVARARSEAFAYLETLPDTLLINVYAPDRMIVWSTSKGLVGSLSREDKELARAFETRQEVFRYRSGDISVRHDAQFRTAPRDFFVENYVPLKDAGGRVVAVVEVYKEPAGLMPAIRKGQLLAWTTTVLGGALVYFFLLGIVRRGDRLLRQQQRQLVEAESQLFAGEMATALAHTLRSPLARVRTSAELALGSTDPSVHGNASDIITQVDFLSQWIRELLLFSRPAGGELEPVDLSAVLGTVLDSFAPACDRAGIRVLRIDDGSDSVLVRASTCLVRQAVHSVVSNAVEAMPRGGELRIELRRWIDPPGVELAIGDTGAGMSKEQLAAAFRPFYTTKAHGLGVGLPMLRRAMERFGGSVTMTSKENAGTRVQMGFCAWRTS
jgi:signal transduction histidine kinase